MTKRCLRAATWMKQVFCSRFAADSVDRFAKKYREFAWSEELFHNHANRKTLRPCFVPRDQKYQNIQVFQMSIPLFHVLLLP